MLIVIRAPAPCDRNPDGSSSPRPVQIQELTVDSALIAPAEQRGAIARDERYSVAHVRLTHVPLALGDAVRVQQDPAGGSSMLVESRQQEAGIHRHDRGLTDRFRLDPGFGFGSTGWRDEGDGNAMRIWNPCEDCAVAARNERVTPAFVIQNLVTLDFGLQVQPHDVDAGVFFPDRNVPCPGLAYPSPD